MSAPKVDVLILPTPGFDTKTGLPNKDGLQRICLSMEAVRYGKADAVAILGDKRKAGPSGAQIHYRDCQLRFPREATKIIHVEAKAVCTNRDLLAYAPTLRKYLEEKGITPSEAVIGAVSYADHLDQIEIVLNHLGFPNFVRFTTNETPHYTPKQIQGLKWVTKHDPYWRWLGLPLIAMTLPRLKEIYIPLLLDKQSIPISIGQRIVTLLSATQMYDDIEINPTLQNLYVSEEETYLISLRLINRETQCTATFIRKSDLIEFSEFFFSQPFL